MKPQIHCKYDELLAISSFRPHPKNRNKHPEKQVTRLAGLYNEHGIRHPIIVSKKSGYVVVGHCRLEAAKKLKIREFPVVYQDFTSEAQEYEFLHADNAIAAWAELDLSEIKVDLNGIEGITIENLAIEGLADVASHARLNDPKAPLVEKKPEKEKKTSTCYVRPGENWGLGAHILQISHAEEDVPEGQRIIEGFEKLGNSERIFLMSDNGELRPLDIVRTERIEFILRKAAAS